MGAKRSKSSLELMKESRNFWGMNPRTRVQEDERKNKKKDRQLTRKEIRNTELD